MKFLFQGDSVI